jgi:hypothetical protein
MVGDLNKHFFASISVVGLICCLCSYSPAEDQPREDPYRVYSDLLRVTFSLGNHKQLVISSRTMNQCDLPPDILEEFKTLRSDTVEDFIDKGRKSVMLENKFATDLTVKLITGDQSAAIFSSKAKRAWKRFFELYPDSQGITSFSQVGFSKDKTQALVCIESRSDWRSGMGHVVLLEWKDNAWLYTLAMPLWDCDAEEPAGS